MATHQVVFYVDVTDPVVDPPEGIKAEYGHNESLDFTAQARDEQSGLKKVIAYLAKKKTEKTDKAEPGDDDIPLTPTRVISEEAAPDELPKVQSISVHVDLSKVPPRQYWLVVAATDRAGLSGLWQKRVEFLAPPPPPPATNSASGTPAPAPPAKKFGKLHVTWTGTVHEAVLKLSPMIPEGEKKDHAPRHRRHL